MNADQRWMARALELAARAWGDTHPNPLVGAVLATPERVLGEGWHARAGGPHAEVGALRDVPDPVPPDATLYITLEPCSTHGRTPPCTELILRRRVRRVVVAATDPNPAHAGRGLDLLRAAGVEVVSGVLAAAAADLNLIFNHAIVQRRPLVAVKVATTLDGRTATRTGRSQWITGPEARLDVARWRRAFPAIGVGVGTLRADAPRLTARLPQAPDWCGRRLVLDGRGASAEWLDQPVFNDPFRDRTVVVTTPAASAAAQAAWAKSGVTVWTVAEATTGPGRVSLAALSARLWSEGLTGLYLEPGAGLLGDLLAQRAIDYVFHYQAPRWWGDAEARPLATGPAIAEPGAGWRLHDVRHESHGDDWLVRGWLRPADETATRGGPR